MYTVGVTGKNVSTSPRSTLNGTTRLQASSRNSTAAASVPVNSRGGRIRSDVHRRSHRQECFHVSQIDTERNHAATSIFQKFHRGRFGSRQLPRRKDPI